MSQGGQKVANGENKANRLTKSKTTMGGMASSSSSSPQLINLLNMLIHSFLVRNLVGYAVPPNTTAVRT
jgi:hypothetical protein